MQEQFTYVDRYTISELINKFKELQPENAETTITRRQYVFICVALVAVVVCMWYLTLQTVVSFFMACTFVFFLLCILKTHWFLKSVKGGLISYTSDQVNAIRDDDLPVYTVLAPCRGEETIISNLVYHLGRLDWPKEKLEIFLLLEANDVPTVQAARKLDLPANFKVIVLEDEGPRTKPKACMVALMAFVTGEFVVVYDAEDQPEPDQLKKAYLAQLEYGEKAWCIQAKLEYHNPGQNLLTRFFSGEYATYFNLTLPALGSMNMLVPLGGTSNHFRTSKLRELGGWDPFNVTEDFNLSIWIARTGGSVKILDSVTWEEANSRLGLLKKGGWIGQRSRWFKGPMQCFWVHMRNPLKLYRELGMKNFFVFLLFSGAVPIALLCSPWFTILATLYILSRTLIPSWNPEIAYSLQIGIEQLFPPAVYYLGVFTGLVGNISLTYFLLLGCMVRRLYSNVPWMIFSPLYWQLMSIPAYKAAIEIFTAPSRWEKTIHGHVSNTTQEVDGSVETVEVTAEAAYAKQ